MFSYVAPERRIPPQHPLRPIREMADDALRGLSRTYSRLYAKTGRPSIPPVQLLRALLLQLLYSVQSERLLMEKLEYNLLCRWFVGLSLDDRLWDVTVFPKNRERLLRGDVAAASFARVLALAKADALLSDEHFSIDGTLIQAWAGQKRFQPKAGPRRPTPTMTTAGTRRSTSAANAAAIRPTPPRPIPTPGSSRRPRAPKRRSGISATC